jgi:chromate transporter
MDNKNDPALSGPRHMRDLFFTFNALALQGFGGVLAVAGRVLVDQKRWLSQAEFVETLSLAQVLPGPNIVNLALMIGDRFFGLRGAFVALAGMLVVPLIIVLALTASYVLFAHNAIVAGALKGMAAVSAGLIAGTALRLSAALKGNIMGVAVCAAVGIITFASVAILRLPQVWVLLIVGLSSCFYAAYLLRHAKVKTTEKDTA